MHLFRLFRTAAFVMVIASNATAQTTSPAAEKDDIIHLPRFEVRENGSKISDFGMSVVTNFGVLFGGKIKWMRVGTVVPGSSAAALGLATDDQIALINEKKVTALTRSQMLHTFFHRKVGDRVKLLVRDDRTKLWRAVELKANEHRIEK